MKTATYKEELSTKENLTEDLIFCSHLVVDDRAAIRDFLHSQTVITSDTMKEALPVLGALILALSDSEQRLRILEARVKIMSIER